MVGFTGWEWDEVFIEMSLLRCILMLKEHCK